MSIFNMAIQVFVVMSSYQSIAQKFKKTGNPRVSKQINKSTNCSDTQLEVWSYVDVHISSLHGNFMFS